VENITWYFLEPLSIPVEDWSKKIQEEVKKSQALIAHYEMLCEQHKVSAHNSYTLNVY